MTIMSNNQREPAINMKDLARRMSQPPEVVDYAPPAVRLDENKAINTVKAFGELPTKEIDEVVSAAEERIAALKADAQMVRDTYVRQTNQLVTEIKRLQKGVELSMNAMKELREQCAKINIEESK